MRHSLQNEDTKMEGLPFHLCEAEVYDVADGVECVYSAYDEESLQSIIEQF